MLPIVRAEDPQENHLRTVRHNLPPKRRDAIALLEHVGCTAPIEDRQTTLKLHFQLPQLPRRAG
ncbi:hypothetical protein C8T65DRAFT_675106 [Cerioporus squamosus]|nr:hypothetical protein C8T65DRAFT_675106 [Cerioporus squamosus]